MECLIQMFTRNRLCQVVSLKYLVNVEHVSIRYRVGVRKKAMQLFFFQKRAAPSQGSGHFEHSKVDSSLLEDELLVKVRENERLHSKVTTRNIFILVQLQGSNAF